MGLSIIVVEDDVVLGDIFKEMLEELTHSDVEWIGDGQAALDRLLEVVPDVVVLDLQMPKVSGLAILNYIRSHSRFSKTRVIIVTADALRAKEARDSADMILIKPVTFADLSRLVEQIKQ